MILPSPQSLGRLSPAELQNGNDFFLFSLFLFQPSNARNRRSNYCASKLSNKEATDVDEPCKIEKARRELIVFIGGKRRIPIFRSKNILLSVKYYYTFN
jgi:hypothetical protein